MPGAERNERRQRQRVSRSIWDKTRRAESNAMDLIKAILYELQPIQFRRVNIQQLLQSCASFVIRSHDTFRKKGLPVARKLWSGLTKTHFMILICVVCYWKAIVYLHQTLHAGPSVIIITLLVIIFTVGLGDDSGNGNGNGNNNNNGNGERLSAYSVFNRGFQNIMGGVDANALIHQHVGGGMPLPLDDHNFNHDNHNNNNNNNNNNNGRARIRQQQQQQQQQQRQNNGQNDEQQPPQKARKSNKKNRRKRNIEQRREIQRQRDAAAAMGFVGDAGNGNGNGNNNNNNGPLLAANAQQDQMAMNRLVEHEIEQMQEYQDI